MDFIGHFQLVEETCKPRQGKERLARFPRKAPRQPHARKEAKSKPWRSHQLAFQFTYENALPVSRQGA